ncbi:lysophospholipid acyltransferase 5-like [Bolinopsis microptera]|uniref:lysophospholipid acyltransferase 5-like n=1 Tax=Bolinopsis microptera TaxID=2820187 RepID=UPI003079A0A0
MAMGESYLVAGILLTFPLALFYRYLLTPYTSPKHKDIFLTVTGLALYFFCFGADAGHVVMMTMCSYLFMMVCGVGATSCIVVLLSSMTHLLYGYITVSGVSYTVTWTLIHCQALLKVVGYFLDLLDEQKDAPESFVAYTAYVFFPFTSLVGPQFQYYRYKKFRETTQIPNSWGYSLKQAGIGVIYIGVFYGIKQFTSSNFIISEEFLSWSLPTKLLFITFWTKWLITKYCAIWCVSESAACLAGMGEQEGGGWDGVVNVEVVKFETSLTIQEELSSFNIQTHQWVKRNVYKRCKVFNSPLLSRVISLTFLYLWHGVYVGFLNLFVVEALGISTEEALNRYISRDKVSRCVPGWLIASVQYVLKNMCVGYGLCGFALRTPARCHVFYSSVYYCFHWGMVLWLVVEMGVLRGRYKKDKST